MSTSRLLAPCIALSIAGLLIASCSQQPSPTAPSGFTVAPGLQPIVAEYFVTLADEAPPPGPEEGEPAPAPPPPPPPPPNSGPTPWPPGPPPVVAPGVPVPTPPSTHIRLSIKLDPEPVPYSGKPVGTYSCRDNKHTWYYDQRLSADTGVAVTFTERENFFDGRFVSKNTETIRLNGNSGVVLHTRWCSAFPKPHYAQTRFKGRDEYGEPVVISGPWARLLTPP